MEFVQKKDKLKDYLILSLIDTVIELYSYNYDIDKEKVKVNLLSKLDEMDILDINISQSNIIPIKNKIINVLKDEIPKKSIDNNISLFENYKQHKLIGNGGFSNVYKVYNPLDEKYYAIKKIGIKNNFHSSLNEVRTIAKLNHPNLIRYHISWIESINLNKMFNNLNNNLLLEDNRSKKTDTTLVKINSLSLINKDEEDTFDSISSEYEESEYDKFLFIQMELCRETLKSYLLNNNFSLEEKKSICKQIVNGLIDIHENKILHRDLKLTNILVDFNNTIKITDFGLAVSIYSVNHEEVGTYGYIAPEIFDRNDYSFKSDLYSLGVIFLEIFKLFKTNMEKVLCIKGIKNENKLDIDDKNIKYVILNMLKNDPKKRMELNKVIEYL